MEWYHILLIVVSSIIVLVTLLFPFILSYLLYSIHMVRTSKKKWTRKCSAPNNDEQLAMWNDGFKYIEKYKENIEDISIISDNLKLHGKYINVNAKRCVIILGGRCECLYYSYYYAKPYLENNCNVFVFDARAHGESEGKINTVGFYECNDVINFAKVLHDKYHNKEIYLHGTCIGAATGIHALAKKDCPKYISKIITDGLYRTYYETFKNHMIEQKRPLWPCLDLCFAFYKHFAKIDAKNDGPINKIKNVNVDIMLLSGLKDQYVFPEMTKELYDLCPSKNKQYHFLKDGGHSHLRINNLEEYDKLVMDFIGKDYA